MTKYFILILLPFTNLACTPFDSDKANKKLIQASWSQVEIIYPNEKGSSLIVEQPEGTTILTFTGDSCIEKMNDLEESTLYTFDIKDYVLKLEKDSANISYLDIQKLTNDSLILHSNFSVWKYVKKAD